MRFKLISCEVLFREMCHACAHSPHQVDVEFLPKGLHDLGGKPMAAKIQEVVDRTPEGVYDAILLGYGLCGNGLDGLTARHTPLVLPRAHDCIALLMGSAERYQAYFEEQPRHLLPLHRLAGARQRPAAVDAQHDGVRRIAGSHDSQIRRGQRALPLRRDDALSRAVQQAHLHRNGTGGGRDVYRTRRPPRPRKRAGASSACAATWHGCGAWWKASGRKPSSWSPDPGSRSRPAMTPPW